MRRPRQDVNRALDLGVAADERVEQTLGGALGEVGREGRDRILDLLLVLVAEHAALARVRVRLLVGRGQLRDPVRDVLEHVEARDPLGQEQRYRARVRLLEDRGEQVARLDLVLLGVLGVGDRGLQDPVERERLARLDRLVTRLLLHVLLEEPVELALQPPQVSARVPQDLRALVVVGEGVQEVLDRQVGVPPRIRLAKGGLQRQLELSVDLAHSGSTPARSG